MIVARDTYSDRMNYKCLWDEHRDTNSKKMQ